MGSFRALGLGVGRLRSAIGVAAAVGWGASSAVVGAAGAGAVVRVGAAVAGMAVGGGGAAVVDTASTLAAVGALAVGELLAGGGGWLTAESQATSSTNSSRAVSKRCRADICRNMDSILIADMYVETTKR
jgi:hypothetical protein